MQTEDSHRFAELMGVLYEVYGRRDKPLSDVLIEVYWNACSELTIEQFSEAVNKIMRTKTMQIFPPPAEIMEAIGDSIEDKALLAFDTLINALDYYRSVVFEDGTIGKVVEAMGGWSVVNDWKTDDRRFHRAEFIKLYKTYDLRGPWPEAKFAGAFEIDNSRKGLTEYIPEPRRIGKQDTERKRLTAC